MREGGREGREGEAERPQPFQRPEAFQRSGTYFSQLCQYRYIVYLTERET
jgi:hypothetical protein